MSARDVLRAISQDSRQRSGASGSGTATLIANNRYAPPRQLVSSTLLRRNEMPFLRATLDIVGRAVATPRWHVSGRGVGRKSADVRRAFEAEVGAAVARGTRSGRPMPVSMARNVAASRLRASGDLRDEDDGPLLAFLNRGMDRKFTGNLIRKMMVQYYLLVGEGFLLLDRDGLGMPFTSMPIPPHWLADVPPTGVGTFRIVSPYGGGMTVPDTEIVQFLDPDLHNPYGRGVGVTRAIATELETDEMVALHSRAVFKNGAIPPYMVTGYVDPEAAKVAKIAWMEQLRGADRAGTPLFLGGTGGDITVKEMGVSLKDLDVSAIRPQLRDLVRQVMAQLPPEVFGDTSQSNRATIVAAKYLQATGSTEPLLEMMFEVYQALAEREFGEGLFLEYESPVPADEQYDLDVLKAAPWAADVDEWRALGGREPLPNGQGKVYAVPIGYTMERDLGNIGYVSSRLQVAPIPEGPPVESPAAPDAGPVEEAPPEGEAPVDGGKAAPNRAGRTIAGALLDAQGDVIGRVLRGRTGSARRRSIVLGRGDHAAIDRLANRMGKVARRAFDDAVAAAQDRIDMAALEKAIAAGDYEAAVRAVFTPPSLADEPPKVVPTISGDLEASLPAPYRQMMGAAGEHVAQGLTDALGTDVTFDPGAHGVTQWQAARVRQMARWLEVSAAGVVRGILDRQGGGELLDSAQAAQMVADHLGLPDQTSKAIEAEVRQSVEEDGKSVVEALAASRVAAAEATAARAASFGEGQMFGAGVEAQRQAWVQGVHQGALPVSVRRYWATRGDESVCKICDGLAGQSAGLSEKFTSTYDDSTVMNPGEAHPGTDTCRCGAVIVLVSAE